MTLKQAKNVKHGDIIHHKTRTNADGTPQRWKVNGQPQTWKRTPSRVRIPVKHGLYSYDNITEGELHLVDVA